MAKFLDQNGVLYFWQKIINKFVAKEAGKGLSTNDFTNAEKQKLAGVADNANNYTLPIAGTGTLGGVKVGAGLAISEDGTMNATGGGTADAVEWNNVLNKPSDFPPSVHEHSQYLQLAGGTMTGNLNMGNQPLTNVPTPSNSSDAVPKSYVDTSVSTKADKGTTLNAYGITDAYTKNEVDSKLSSTYKPAGSIYFAQLPTPSAANLGFVYSMNDAFTTDDRFLASEPVSYPIGTNIVVVAVEGSTYKFDVLSGFIDLSEYMKSTDMVAITNEEIDSIVA